MAQVPRELFLSEQVILQGGIVMFLKSEKNSIEPDIWNSVVVHVSSMDGREFESLYAIPKAGDKMTPSIVRHITESKD